MKLTVLVLLIFASHALTAENANELRHESKRLGLRYRHPQNFVVGEYRKETVHPEMKERGLGSQQNDAEVLVERRLAKDRDLRALPMGKFPMIQLNRSRGKDADFLRKFMLNDRVREQLRQTIGSWTVYVLPGYPAPYGDQALYYLIPLKDGSIVEILAPKIDREEKPTHYEPVIRRLIESLEITETEAP